MTKYCFTGIVYGIIELYILNKVTDHSLFTSYSHQRTINKTIGNLHWFNRGLVSLYVLTHTTRGIFKVAGYAGAARVATTTWWLKTF
jgi:hypothetical protein